MPDVAPTTEAPAVHPANDRPAEPNFDAPPEGQPEGQSAATQQPAAVSPPVPEGGAPSTPATPPPQEDRALQRREAALVRREQQATQMISDAQRQLAQLPALVEAAKKELIEAYKKDPIAFSKTQAGIDVNTLAGRILSDGKQTTEETIASLQAEVKALREERQQEKTSAQNTKAETDFWSLVESSDKDTPEILDTWDRQDVIRLGHQIANELAEKERKSGRPVPQFTLQDFYDELAERAKKEQARRNDRLKKRSGDATAAAGKTDAQAATKPSDNGSGHQEQPKPGATAATSTLRNGVGNERSKVPSSQAPELFESPEEERRLVLEAAEKARQEVMAKSNAKNGVATK